MVLESSETLEFVKNLATEAGEIAVKGFFGTEDLEIKDKGVSTDLVTKIDKEVEVFVTQRLLSQFPNTSVLGEESGKKEIVENEPTWIVDPIDGTTNFVHRYPFISICIGLSINKVPVLGVVFNPVNNEMYSALKGHGAFLNGSKIRVSHTTQLNKALISTNIGSNRSVENVENTLEMIRRFMNAKVHSLRSMGSAALDICQVACGRTDLFFEKGLHSWDIAAASIIVREAGGIASNIDGSDLDLVGRNYIASSSALLHNEAVDLLK